MAEPAWHVRIVNETKKPFKTHQKSIERVEIPTKGFIEKKEEELVENELDIDVDLDGLEMEDDIKEAIKDITHTTKEVKKEELARKKKGNYWHDFPVINFLGDKFSPFIFFSEFDEDHYGLLVELKGQNEAVQIAMKTGTMTKQADRWMVISNQISGRIMKGTVTSSLWDQKKIEIDFDKNYAIPLGVNDTPKIRFLDIKTIEITC